MFGQNNIERWGPLYARSLRDLFPYFSSTVFFLFHIFFSPNNFHGTRPRERKACSCSRLLPIFFCLTRLVKHDVLNTKAPGSPRLRLAQARIFIFHFNLYFSRSTHVHEKGRTFGHSCGIHTASTRPDGGNLRLLVDRWIALARRNYLVVITTGRRLMTPASSDAILKIFSKVARDVITSERARRDFSEESDA